MKIDELEINSELIKAVKELGFEEPTLIQEKTVPIVRKGTDVIAQAKTGSGKTAAFGLPILEKIEPRKAKSRYCCGNTRKNIRSHQQKYNKSH